MSDNKFSNRELRERLDRAEATLDALRNGEVDIVVGSSEPLVVKFSSLVKEKERLLESLRMAAQEWRKTFDAMADAVFIHDPDHGILRVNRAAEQIFGRPGKDFIGKRCWEIVHGAAQPITECPFLRAKHSLRLETLEIQAGERWIRCRVDPILNPDGAYGGAVHTVEDITERKQNEAALRDSERKLAIKNQIANVFLTFSDDRMYAEILHVVLEAMESRYGVFGYIDDKGALVCPAMTGDIWDQCRMPDKDIIFPPEKWGGMWGKAMTEKKTLYVNRPSKVPEGHIPITRALNVPIIYQGELVGNFLVGNKETDYNEKDRQLIESISTYVAPILHTRLQRDKQAKKRKQLEDQLRHAQKMEAIGVLAGGVAHDFNNVLTTILGNAELALSELSKDAPFYDDLTEIKKAGEKAAGLTRQLLSFSRRETRAPEVMDLNEALEEMKKMLRRLIREDIELAVIPCPDLWKVFMDPTQVDQIVMNLAVNARDAMPEGGTLTIETANVELDRAYFQEHGVQNDPGPYVMLAVTDTGTGMDKDVQRQIFDPFFTTKDRGTGTGLGLSTVYGIVKQNRGYIWNYSEPGEGTTLKVYLPRAENVPGPDIREKVQADGLTGTETVLVAEDNESVRKLAVKSLGKYGYRVLEADSGPKALEISSRFEGKIHLLITDVIMPGMNGKELAKRLRSERPGMEVLFMSGYTHNIILQKGILSSNINYIQKPFSPEALAVKLKEVLGVGCNL